MRNSSRTRKRRNIGRPWSEKDLQKLIELYSTTHHLELARMFYRASGAVLSKARILGLKKEETGIRHMPERCRMWTKGEIEILKKMHPFHTFDEISDVINRCRFDRYEDRNYRKKGVKKNKKHRIQNKYETNQI